jgi:type II secretory pathway pseudopilin PulG
MKRGWNKKIKSKIFYHIFFPKKDNGQIWIETVIYTLIAMLLIGLVLSYANPKIEGFIDKVSIEKSMNFLMALDNTINEIQSVPGNTRLIEFTLSNGKIEIDGENDKITFEMQSRYEYSESGETFTENGFNISTEDQGKYKIVTISKNYPNNLTYDGLEQLRTITKASAPYRISISNNGFSGGTSIIDISVN